MSGDTILVVDDERNIVQLARIYLANEGFRVEAAYDGQEALDKVRSLRPSLVVLDLMMPGLDGWEVCRRLRRESDVPIIILTARGDDVDRIVGLELGADDYVVKPFNPRELAARVKAVLRRYRAGQEQKTRVVVAGDLRVDLDSREAWDGERALDLRPKEFELLATLARHPGVAFEREKLLQLAWGYDYLGDSRTVDVHVAWLREKLAGGTVRIETVRGIGYKLVTQPSGARGHGPGAADEDSGSPATASGT